MSPESLLCTDNICRISPNCSLSTWPWTGSGLDRSWYQCLQLVMEDNKDITSWFLHIQAWRSILHPEGPLKKLVSNIVLSKFHHILLSSFVLIVRSPCRMQEALICPWRGLVCLGSDPGLFLFLVRHWPIVAALLVLWCFGFLPVPWHCSLGALEPWLSQTNW